MATTTSQPTDKRDLLKQPLHNIYIPIMLILGGTLIFGVQYIPYAVAFIVVVCSIQFARVWGKRSSLHPKVWRDFELIDKTIVSRNSAIYRFKLRRDDEVLDIPPGHNVACCFDIDGKDEIRYYSPISNEFDAGFFDILVKSYPRGLVSSRFAQLKEGQTVKFRGPVGKLDYVPNMAKRLGLVAGGSGITPILQVLTAIITNPKDHTDVDLIYANDTENDILLKNEIDQIAERWPGDRLRVFYTLTKPPADWNGGVGYVSRDMMEEHLPAADDENQLFICGPPEMKKSVKEFASELGWNSNNVFCF
ncbi:hypothetical protein DIURU_001624 [Diutina rugosa]|uniref:NADH-cytochrome b5 reductase n=1 Tax=Diutina rugosa TaxID=5481 RepID=A0A642UTA0_DIURU|nr:uncharacterized protein DIURU_001624 [Diutina rugosa]KAA8905196.1 hypothetical protein DIURU_001624 [Diutina rugosa]